MEDLAQAAIEAALKAGAKFADVRIENSITTIIEMTDGITRRSLGSKLKGAGIRAFIDGAWAFALNTDFTMSKMRETGESVARLALATKDRVTDKFEIEGPTYQGKKALKLKRPFSEVSTEEKMNLVKTVDHQARIFDKRIINTRTIYGELQSHLYIANSLGTSVWAENSIPRLVSISTAKEGTNRRQGQKSYSTRGGFEDMDAEEPMTLGESSAKLAIELLASSAAKGGTYDVIMDPILNGVVVHEAFGHASEADNWLAHNSVLEGKFQQNVGPDHLNISDDPTLSGVRGSYDYDWEGTRTAKRVLVKNGILNELFHDLETATRLGMKPNGSSRCQSFMHTPAPRMSNTFMEPGDWGLDELLADTKEGILLCNYNYGYTEVSKGQFLFQADHGFIIKNGEKGKMIRDVSLAGQILEVLAKIDAVTNDFDLHGGACGKAGQSVPTTIGGPYARIKETPVGGI